MGSRGFTRDSVLSKGFLASSLVESIANLDFICQHWFCISNAVLHTRVIATLAQRQSNCFAPTSRLRVE